MPIALSDRRVMLLGAVRPSQAASYKQIYSFNGSDGFGPSGALLAEKNGVLYGTTEIGGTAGEGTVFSLTPPTSSGGNWTESVLWNFQSTSSVDGAKPVASLIMDANGNLYGTTSSGGSFSDQGFGDGTVLELSPAAGNWNESLLWNFDGSDGENPQAGLLIGANGLLFGTTFDGGNSFVGVVFALPAGGPIHILHSFGASPTDGIQPADRLIPAVAGGRIFGTTTGGGDSQCGTVFELSNAAGKATQNVIYSFFGGQDGCYPSGSVVSDRKGVLYGTTSSGGAYNNSFLCNNAGCGTVFSLTPPAIAGGVWTETVLHSFAGDDGARPQGVVIGPGGVLYGTTYLGGSFSLLNGTVFSLTPPTDSGTSWTETVLHSFGGAMDGINPVTGLTPHNGILYGTTQGGGNGGGYGTVFGIIP